MVKLGPHLSTSYDALFLEAKTLKTEVFVILYVFLFIHVTLKTLFLIDVGYYTYFLKNVNTFLK